MNPTSASWRYVDTVDTVGTVAPIFQRHSEAESEPAGNIPAAPVTSQFRDFCVAANPIRQCETVSHKGKVAGHYPRMDFQCSDVDVKNIASMMRLPCGQIVKALHHDAPRSTDVLLAPVNMASTALLQRQNWAGEHL